MKTEQTEMEYGQDTTFKILAHDTYRNIPYWIISRGTHPCTYIELSNYLSNHPVKNMGEYGEGLNINCHGGVTYCEDYLTGVWNSMASGFSAGEKTFVGWDYAHSGDWFGRGLFGGHKYTIEELVGDVRSSIDSLYDEEP